MFAVPGWAVSADNLITEKAIDGGHGGERKKEQQKKRKREERDRGEKIKDLENAWRRQFEGGERTTKKKRKKYEDESAKDDSNGVRLPKLDSQRLQESITKNHNMPSGKDISLESVSKTSKKRRKANTNIIMNGENLQAGPNRALHRVDGQDTQSPAEIPSKHTKPKERATTHKSLVDASSKASARSSVLSLPPAPQPQLPPTSSLTPLQSRMRSKLLSARFRHLNETLYSTPSSASLSLFASDPSLFSEYHTGFSQQVKESWPQNPVDEYLKMIQQRAQVAMGKHNARKGSTMTSGDEEKQRSLPRRPNGLCTLADLGCGDAALARSLTSSAPPHQSASSKILNIRVNSYDLYASNEYVTQADIASLPLRDGEIDIAIFCLSLMGTNWIDFVEEAWRILRGDGKGECWVSEVKSRFGRPEGKSNKGTASRQAAAKSGRKGAKSKKRTGPGPDDDDGTELPDDQIFAEDSVRTNVVSGADETDISPFIKVFERRGFVLRPQSVLRANKMFISMVFTKAGVPTKGRWRGMKWVGGKHVTENVNDSQEQHEDEGTVLKPCVYKIR
ncbi:MAG: hypothetical protein Q9160_009031 [Pyrenula sp. 1 TL-2023]